MPPVDVVAVVDALGSRARWPFEVFAGLMSDAPEVLPDVLRAGVDRLAPGSAAMDAVVGLDGSPGRITILITHPSTPSGGYRTSGWEVRIPVGSVRPARFIAKV